MKGRAFGARIAPAVLAASCVLSCGRQPPPAAPPPRASPPPASPSASAALQLPPPTPDAPFRERPPEPAAPVAWSPPRIDAWTLPNGARVLFVERHDLPIVSVRVVATVGGGDVLGAHPGTVAFMGAMLEQGAGKRDALAISDQYEALGADHAAGCDWDACVASIKVLSSRVASALNVLSDIVVRPTFPVAEVERLRKRWLASFEQEKSSPPMMEQNALAAAVFGRGHPYGHSLRGAPAYFEKLSRGEIEGVWRRAVRPGSTALVVAGDVATANLHAILQADFGEWRGGVAVRPVVPQAPRLRAGSDAPIVVVDVPGAAQSQVFVAEEGAAMSTPDRIPLTMMNLILGGLFSSRINLDLREAHAYTYGAHSRFSMRHGAGPFVAGGAMFAEHTGDAIRELLTQIRRMRDEAVTAEELADAKEQAKLALPARFESVGDVTDALQEIAVYGLPLDEFASRAARIDGVTVAEVQRVAQQWLRADAMRIVVTGDRAKIEKDLSSLGRIEWADAYGDTVK